MHAPRVAPLLTVAAISWAAVACAPSRPRWRPPPAATPCATPTTLATPPPLPDVLEDTITTDALTFHFRASPTANLVYELDCLTELAPCSLPAYRELWKDTIHLEPGDEEALATWRALRKRYESAEPIADPSSPPSPGEPAVLVRTPDDGFDLNQHVRIAGCVAGSPDDWRRLESLLLRPADVDGLDVVLRRFEPRFAAWWKATGRASIAPFHAGLVELFRRGPLAATIEQVALFYGASLPKGTAIDFNLMVRPESASKTTRAEQIANHAIIETIPGESPSERVDVVSHELFHFFYNSRAAAAQRALARRITGASDPLAVVAYELLDESIATALGNGLVASEVAPDRFAKRLAKDHGFYNDRAIDRVAKAMYPRVKALLAEGATIDSPAFAEGLLAATHESLDKDLMPNDYLHSFVAATSAGFASAVTGYEAAASVNDTYVDSPIAAATTIEHVREYPEQSGMVLVTPGDIPSLASWGDFLPAGTPARLTALAAKSAPFVFTVRRTSKAHFFVLVAKDVASMAALGESLARAGKITLGEWRPLNF